MLETPDFDHEHSALLFACIEAIYNPVASSACSSVVLSMQERKIATIHATMVPETPLIFELLRTTKVVATCTKHEASVGATDVPGRSASCATIPPTLERQIST